MFISQEMEYNVKELKKVLIVRDDLKGVYGYES